MKDGSSFNLVCVVPRIPTPEVTWERDNVTLTTEFLLTEGSSVVSSTLELSMDEFNEDDSGTYRCVASYLDAEVAVCEVQLSAEGNGEIWSVISGGWTSVTECTAHCYQVLRKFVGVQKGTKAHMFKTHYCWHF